MVAVLFAIAETVAPIPAEVTIEIFGTGTPVLVLVNVKAALLQTVAGILKLAVGVPQDKILTTRELVEEPPVPFVTLSETVYDPKAEKVITGTEAVVLENKTPAGTADQEKVKGGAPTELLVGLTVTSDADLQIFTGSVKTELKVTPLYFQIPSCAGFV
jgi:hypothetical protein